MKLGKFILEIINLHLRVINLLLLYKHGIMSSLCYNACEMS